MKEGRAERYFDSQAGIYDLTRRFFLRDREKAVALLDIEPGNRVIDFGCGTGLNFEHIERAGAAKITGIDMSRRMLDRARRKHPKAELVKSDLSTGPATEPAERAICTYALSLVEDWQSALVNMKRSLTPEGKLVVLDFHPLKGVMRPLDPLFRWWITIHGADPARRMVPFLRDHFVNVAEYVPAWGFDVILVASRPFPSD